MYTQYFCHFFFVGIHTYTTLGIRSDQIRIHIARVWMLGFAQLERRETKLGFGCSVSHRRNRRQGVGVPGGCSRPTKITKMEASAPGVGRRRRWRWRPPSRRHQRRETAHARATRHGRTARHTRVLNWRTKGGPVSDIFFRKKIHFISPSPQLS